MTPLLAFLVLVALTAYAAIIDIRWMRLPDGANLAIFVSGILSSIIVGVIDPIAAFSASAISGAALLALRQAFWIYRGYEGLGLGDVKYVAGAATWIGLEGLPLTLLCASSTALLFLLLQRLWSGQRLDRRQRIPFGPFLGIGAIAVAGLQLLSGFSLAEIMEQFVSM